jgi:hypothetical protein
MDMVAAAWFATLAAEARILYLISNWVDADREDLLKLWEWI